MAGGRDKKKGGRGGDGDGARGEARQLTRGNTVPLQRLLAGNMVDYKGQARAETLLVVCFVVICTPAWIYGYSQQDFAYPFQAWVAATAASALLVLPNWPIYNRNQIKWLPSAMYVKKKST